MKTTVEVANAQHVELALKYKVDVLWIGARTTVNPFSVQEIADAIKIAHEVGFPVIVKASAGGGGKGMRIVWEEKEFEKAFQTAQTEAGAAFNNSDVYIEKDLSINQEIEKTNQPYFLLNY